MARGQLEQIAALINTLCCVEDRGNRKENEDCDATLNRRRSRPGQLNPTLLARINVKSRES